jgi:hypothetical protein
MPVSSNVLIVIAGSMLLLALVIFIKSRIRRSTTHSLTRLRRTRIAADDALRDRLERKIGTGADQRNQKLESSC